MPEERDRLFAEILARQDYIIEDTGRAVFEEGMVRADKIILLETPSVLRKFRIIRRYIRQKLNLEKCSYKPSLKMLRHMFRWSRNYQNGKDGVRERVLSYGQKVTILKSKKHVREFIKQLSNRGADIYK
jgi:adenylate kinase family enzyme